MNRPHTDPKDVCLSTAFTGVSMALILVLLHNKGHICISYLYHIISHYNYQLFSPSSLPDSVLASWVPLMSSWQCKKRYGDSFSSHGTLCAGSPPDTSLLHGDSCQGNSGGGLVCQEETGRWVLTGVVAGGYGCSDPSSPALYTRVSRFRSWVDEVINTRAHPGEPQTHTQTPEALTHNDLTHAHEEHTHNDKYFQVPGKLKDTLDQPQTNEINELKQKHTHQHVNTHTKSTHTHHGGDANTQILA